MLSGQDGLRNLNELMAISVDDELAFKDLSAYINWGVPFLQPLSLQNRKVISNMKVKNNFRTNDDNYLHRIREKYKPFLQDLQQLHNINTV